MFPCGLSFHFEDQFLYPRSVIFIVIFSEQKKEIKKKVKLSYGNIIT